MSQFLVRHRAVPVPAPAGQICGFVQADLANGLAFDLIAKPAFFNEQQLRAVRVPVGAGAGVEATRRHTDFVRVDSEGCAGEGIFLGGRRRSRLYMSYPNYRDCREYGEILPAADPITLASLSDFRAPVLVGRGKPRNYDVWVI